MPEADLEFKVPADYCDQSLIEKYACYLESQDMMEEVVYVRSAFETNPTFITPVKKMTKLFPIIPNYRNYRKRQRFWSFRQTSAKRMWQMFLCVLTAKAHHSTRLTLF